MKVALVTPGWPSSSFTNGIATYVDILHQGFAHTDVDVRLLAANTEGIIDPDIIPLDRLPAPNSFGSRLLDWTRGHLSPTSQIRAAYVDSVLRGLSSLSESFRPDLIEMEETFGAFELVAARIDIPVVVRLHGPYFLNAAALSMPHDRFYRDRVKWEESAISKASSITSPSADLVERVRQKYGKELPPVEVIPNPAPYVRASQLWSSRAADPNLILFVGRFDNHKGGDLVLEAFAKVASMRPNLTLAFIGPDWGLRDGGDNKTSYSEFVTNRISDKTVRARIKYLGTMNSADIVNWRLRAAFTLVASRYEVFGMTVLEALAHGCPLIASRVGGIKEIVVDEANGLLFEPGDSENLASCIKRLLDSPRLAAKLGAQGADDARTRFAPRVVAEQTRNYYERVIDKR